MKMRLNKVKLGLIGLVGAGLLSSQAGAVQDVLDTPALTTSKGPESLLIDIAKAGDRLVTVGERGHIIYSDDKGLTWQQASVPVSVLLTAVSFVDDSHGWAVGHSGVVLHTTDSGHSWVEQFDGNQANKMVITQVEKRIERLNQRLDSASEEEQADIEFEIEEASFSLDDARMDAEVGASKPFLDVLFSSRNEGFAVGAYGYFFKTKDGGMTWENYGSRIENPDRFHLNAITRIKSGALFIVGEAGVMFRSTDGGESWETLESPYSGSLFGVAGTNERNVVMVLGLRGHLYRSQDAGDTWKQIDAGTESTLMSAAINQAGDISIVGNSGTVLFSKDGGKSFTEIIREDRLSNTSAVFVDNDTIALVGENGVNLAESTGQSVR
jgi:photosystem II stability/assembly factor-like uncharacterized protein